MQEEKLEDFTVIKSRFSVFEKDGTRYILKDMKPTAFSGECKKVHDLILEYVSKVRQAEIPMPEIEYSHLEDNAIKCICKYVGRNLVQEFGSNDLIDLVKKHHDVLEEVVKNIKKAQEANLFIDPHIKNFTIDNNKLYYVDFSPPYSEAYNRMRLEYALESERDIVRENLDAFSPCQLGYHFAGDLLKEDARFGEVIEEVYGLLIGGGVIHDDFKNFLVRANAIKDVELTRVKREIYLI